MSCGTPVQFSGTGEISMLKDTTTECAMAAFGDTCLEFKHHNGISCGRAGHSALQSAIILRSPSEPAFLRAGEVIYLGERGELRLKSYLGGILVVEWSSPNPVITAFRSKFSRELVHREHTDIDHSKEGDKVQPVPIFVVSERPRGAI
jgi:hypothetical protein